MDNVLIEINKKTRQVFLTNSVIGNDGENLQENLVFSFNDEFVDGTGRLELIKPDKTKSYIMLTKIDETYQIPVKSIITKGGRLSMQLVITQGTKPNAIPIFKSNKFYVVVNSSINFLIEEPDEYPQWIDVANAKLNEIDEAIQEASNLDIDVNKEDDVTTITLTDKEGQTKEVQILDGQDGEQGPQGIQGPVGPAGADGKDGIDGQDGKDGKDGKDGIDGQDATINGVNTINIEAGENITLEQQGNTLTINSTGGGAVTSVNGQTGNVVLDIPDSTSDLTNDSGFINNTVSNLTNYELKADTGHSIAMSIDSSTYVLTLSLKNSAGTILNTQTVDLPLESVVVDGEYDSTNKKIVLELQSGSTIDIPVGDLINGLQSEITSSNKLNADLVDDTNTTNKFVSASDKTAWNGKYDKPSGGIPSTDLSSAVQTSLGKADTAIQSNDLSSVATSGDYDDLLNKPTNVSAFINDMGYITKPTYLGPTKDFNTEEKAINLNDLPKGLYILKHDSNNNALYLKAKYKLNSSATATTQVLQISLFERLASTKVALNEILLYIDTAVTEDTVGTSSGFKIGSLVVMLTDNLLTLQNRFNTIKLGNSSIMLGTSTYEDLLLETSSNKVSTISNSSTNIQYAGAKAVWDLASVKLDTSKVKNANSTTAGDVYDVRYINGLIGDINTILATLTTPQGGNQ